MIGVQGAFCGGRSPDVLVWDDTENSALNIDLWVSDCPPDMVGLFGCDLECLGVVSLYRAEKLNGFGWNRRNPFGEASLGARIT